MGEKINCSACNLVCNPTRSGVCFACRSLSCRTCSRKFAPHKDGDIKCYKCRTYSERREAANHRLQQIKYGETV